MHGKPPGHVVLNILATLRDGPKTRAEIQRETGIDGNSLGSVLGRLLRHYPVAPKRIYISGWARADLSGARRYLRAVYALGDREDAPRPPPASNTVRCREYRHRKKRKINSIFNLK